MKKWSIFFLVIVLALAFSQTALAKGEAPAGATSYYVPGEPLGTLRVINCESWVSLRSYPSTSAERITRVYKGETVQAYWYNYHFAECYYYGMHGYILLDYLSFSGNSYNSNNSYKPQSDGARDLSNYGYRAVTTKGRGALVFQSSPRGSFMSDHKFYDGDWVYVNLYWRKDGYAIAYENGVYGYVDASYIDW